jgi:hypothetical protein
LRPIWAKDIETLSQKQAGSQVLVTYSVILQRLKLGEAEIRRIVAAGHPGQESL